MAVGAKGVYRVVPKDGGWSASVDGKELGGFHDRAAAERQAERHEAEEKPAGPVRSIPPPAATKVAEESVPYAVMQRDPEEIDRGRALGVASTPRAVYDMLSPTLAKESQEVFLVLPLDLRGQPLSRPVEVARGQRDRVHVDPSDIFRPVKDKNAKGFVVVHVHPSGHATPSPADRDLTKRIQKGTLEIWGDGKGSKPTVTFLDHVIIARSHSAGEYYSFREGKLTVVRG